MGWRLPRLAVSLRGRQLRLLAAATLGAMVLVGAEFVVLSARESGLIERFSDSSWWMASLFRSEIAALHVSLATADASHAGLEDVRERYGAVTTRIGMMDQAPRDMQQDAAFLDAYRLVRTRLMALAPRIEALRPDDTAALRTLAEQMRRAELDAAHMTALAQEEDVAQRDAMRRAVHRANLVFAVTDALLIGTLLLALRAVLRHARVEDAARRRSEALSADLAAALARAEAGARAKSAFLATISHEVRTPMNGVLGAASLLAHTGLSAAQRRWVEIVQVCGEALLAQLDDVLDFSALEAEAVVAQPELLDVRALVEATTKVVETTAGPKRLDLAVVAGPDVPLTLVADRRRLAQVLLNLLTNAVKFTPSGGVAVRVALRRRAGRPWLRVAVVDTGPGVPRAERRRIFEEFTRLERDAEPPARGTGLGLAISRRIATTLRGRLNVAGAHGGGSLFWLSIPVEIPADAVWPVPRPPLGTAAVLGAAAPVRQALADMLRTEGYVPAEPGAPRVSLLLRHTSLAAPPGCAAERVLTFGPGGALEGTLTGAALHAALIGGPRPAPPPEAPAQAPMALLLADDDPINREIAASLLRHLGHAVTVAEDGAAALAAALSAAAAQPFNCILLDLHMPGLDGTKLARRLRAQPGPVARTRLVAVTADTDARARAAMQAAGFDAILAKPVTLERLAGAVAGAAPPPGPAEVIEAQVRRMLAARIAPERIAALVRTFWEELLRALRRPGGLPGSEADRRLHSLAGSSASLGYSAVAAAARLARARLGEPAALPAALAGLHAALAAALAADAALVPADLAGSIGTALAAAADVEQVER